MGSFKQQSGPWLGRQVRRKARGPDPGQWGRDKERGHGFVPYLRLLNGTDEKCNWLDDGEEEEGGGLKRWKFCFNQGEKSKNSGSQAQSC